MNVEIKNLADCPHLVEEVSELIWEEFSKKEGRPLEEVVYRTRHCLCKDRIPQTFVALKGNRIVGTGSIWNNDLKNRQDLTPWLSVYI